MLKVNADNEYKAVERVYSGSTEIDKILDKNGNVLFAVNKEVEGTPALTYKGKEETNLKNYRIYGNTVDGESVGNRSGNLWNEIYDEDGNLHYVPIKVKDGEYTLSTTTPNVEVPGGPQATIFLLAGNVNTGASTTGNGCWLNNPKTVQSIDGYVTIAYDATEFVSEQCQPWNNNTMLNSGSEPLPYEPCVCKVPVTVEGKNLWSGVVEQGDVSQDGVYSSDNKRIRSKNVPIEPGTYMISSNVLMRIIYAYNDDQKIGVCLNSAEGVYSRSFTVPAGANNIAISMMKRVAGAQVDITPSDFIWGQIEKGSEATTYEPYHAPFTTNLYLPEPLKMVGDEAEYIDYAEQKQHRVRKNLFNTSNLTQNINLTSTDGLPTNYAGRIGITTPISINGNVTLSYSTENNTNIAFMYTLFRNDEFIGRTIHKSSGDTIQGENGDKIYIVFYIDGAFISINNISNIMLNSGTETLPYEPYIEDTELDIAIPALLTLSGTNTLTVGTEVQPSNVYLKGRIKEVS